MRVALCASRLRGAQKTQVHGVLRGKENIVAVISVLAALDGRRGVGAIPLQEVLVGMGIFRVG